jgi:release factor glutamine methyltransferase
LAELWTVLKVLQWTTGYFGERGIEGGRLDAELLLGDTLGLDRVGLYLNYDRPLSAGELETFRGAVGRRAKREPLAYIRGRAEFWSLPLAVSPAVLIPRPDTEVLVEEALKRIASPCRILDVGTGSGAIAIALAHELPGAQVEGVDISREALAVARQNAERNAVAERVTLRENDLRQLQGVDFDLVVSNPPYIPTADLGGLMPEVKQYEPLLALDGGSDGLSSYRLLSAQARTLLKPAGWLLLEVGIGQAAAVADLLQGAGLVEIFTRADYAGVPRVVGGRRPN